jgi:hypothetical protein
MKDGEHQKLVNALTGLIVDALTGPKEVSREEKAMMFSYADKGGGLLLSKTEAAKMQQASELLSAQFPKVSERTCMRELQRFCCSFISEINAGQQLPVARQIPALLKLLESLGSHQTTVYVEVSGLDLRLPEWTFGPARFMSGNHVDVERDRLGIRTLDGQTPEPLRAEQLVVQMRLEGESQYAQDSAKERVQQVLDVLQFLSLKENPGSWDADLAHFGLFCCEPIPVVSTNIWAFSSDGPSWHWHKEQPPVLVSGPMKCVVSKDTDARFAERGGKELAALLMEQHPSAFDQGLLTAVTWIAHAIRERDPARKFLGFYIALEALFGRDNKKLRECEGFQQPIVPIPEGVAFLLGLTPQARIRLVDRMTRLTRERNRIVHRGFTQIEKGSLLMLAGYAWSSCWQAAIRRHLFQKEDAFRDWLLERKYGNADGN